MSNVTFITGNNHKADYFSRQMGMDIAHTKVELDELQSLDLHEIVAHKLKQAYDVVQSPVVVEDVSLSFTTCTFGYYDGSDMRFFDSSMKGSISKKPAGENGFGFDAFFIMEGYDKTRAELEQDEVERTYAENMKPFGKVREFFERTLKICQLFATGSLFGIIFGDFTWILGIVSRERY